MVIERARQILGESAGPPPGAIPLPVHVN